MGLPFKLLSLQGLWFISSLMAIVCAVGHFILAIPTLFSKQLFDQLGSTVRGLFVGVFVMIALSYVATLCAQIGGWWEQAKKSNSKWTMLMAFFLLSDSVHYTMYCTLFASHADDFFRFPCLSLFILK